MTNYLVQAPTAFTSEFVKRVVKIELFRGVSEVLNALTCCILFAGIYCRLGARAGTHQTTIEQQPIISPTYDQEQCLHIQGL